MTSFNFQQQYSSDFSRDAKHVQSIKLNRTGRFNGVCCQFRHWTRFKNDWYDDGKKQTISININNTSDNWKTEVEFKKNVTGVNFILENTLFLKPGSLKEGCLVTAELVWPKISRRQSKILCDTYFPLRRMHETSSVLKADIPWIQLCWYWVQSVVHSTKETGFHGEPSNLTPPEERWSRPLWSQLVSAAGSLISPLSQQTNFPSFRSFLSLSVTIWSWLSLQGTAS